MFKIGDFSKLTKVSVRMLRYYETVGLISPAHIDNFSGYRYYHAGQIGQMNKIIELRDLGCNVKEIQSYLALGSQEEQILFLKQKEKEVIAQIEKEQFKLEAIKYKLEVFEKGGSEVKYKIEIKSLPKITALVYRENNVSYEEEERMWGRFAELMKGLDVKSQDMPFAILHDNDLTTNNIDIEIVMPVEQEIETHTTELLNKEIQPIQQSVCALIPGSYKNIAVAYEHLGQYIEENGYEMIGQTRQIPIVSPYSESDENKFLTEVQIPVKIKA